MGHARRFLSAYRLVGRVQGRHAALVGRTGAHPPSGHAGARDDRPQPDGLSNFIYRFADTLAAPFETTEDGVLTGLARDLLLAIAVQRHPKWFDGGAEGGTPALRFSIDPSVSLYTAALQPGSIAIDRL
jgi:hypothetical protein